MENKTLKILCLTVVFMLFAASAFSQGMIPQQNRVLSKQWVSNAMEHFNNGDLKKSTECLEKAMMYDPENEDAQTLMYEVMNLALREVKERETAVKTVESRPVTSKASGYDFSEYDEPASLEFTNQLEENSNNQTMQHQGTDQAGQLAAMQEQKKQVQKTEKKKGFFGSIFSGGLFSKKKNTSQHAQKEKNIIAPLTENNVPQEMLAKRAASEQRAYSDTRNDEINQKSSEKKSSSLMSLFASGSLVNSRRSPVVSGMMSRAVEYKPQYRLVSSYLKTTPDTLGKSLASNYENNYRSTKNTHDLTKEDNRHSDMQRQTHASSKSKSYKPDNEMDRVRVNELNELGLEYANKSQFKKAVPLFEKALSIEPGNLVALNNLALACAYNDDLYSAIKTYRKIMTLTNPGSEYNKLARSMIKKLKQII